MAAKETHSKSLGRRGVTACGLPYVRQGIDNYTVEKGEPVINDRSFHLLMADPNGDWCRECQASLMSD